MTDAGPTQGTSPFDEVVSQLRVSGMVVHRTAPWLSGHIAARNSHDFFMQDRPHADVVLRGMGFESIDSANCPDRLVYAAYRKCVGDASITIQTVTNAEVRMVAQDLLRTHCRKLLSGGADLSGLLELAYKLAEANIRVLDLAEELDNLQRGRSNAPAPRVEGLGAAHPEERLPFRMCRPGKGTGLGNRLVWETTA